MGVVKGDAGVFEKHIIFWPYCSSLKIYRHKRQNGIQIRITGTIQVIYAIQVNFLNDYLNNKAVVGVSHLTLNPFPPAAATFIHLSGDEAVLSKTEHITVK